MFAVGDTKQSIYSFQGAQPREFGVVRAELEQRACGANRSWNNVPLDISFRSTAPVLEAVDAVFADSEVRRSVVFDDAEYRPHFASRTADAGCVSL